MKKTIRISAAFRLGDFVVLRTDEARRRRMVTTLSVSMNGVRYELMCGTESSWHFDGEIELWVDDGRGIGFGKEAAR